MDFSAMNKTSSPIVSPPYLAIRAAAGTGKTYSLTRRYLMLIDRGVPPSRILATTFTRKAAAEIANRILGRLAAAALSAIDRDDLARFLDREQITLEQTEALLDQLVDAWPHLRIGTLDRFFSEMARAQTWDLKLPAGWKLIDPIEDEPLRAQAITLVFETLGHRAVAHLTQLLFKGESARSIYEEIDSVSRELHELWSQIPIDAWSAVPTAAELNPQQLEDVLGSIEDLSLAGPGQEKARSADLELARKGDWKELVTKGFVKAIANGKEKLQGVISEETRRAYEPLIEHARAQRQNPLAHQNQATHQLLASFDEHYRRQQIDSLSLRFSDITRLLLSLGATIPTSSPLRPVEHLLLDEFQDTSVPQWKVLLPLVHQCVSVPAGSIFIVGDPKQAIYGWRGGAAELLDELDPAIPNLARQDLIESRRSSPIILDFVNTIFGSIQSNSVMQSKDYLVQAAKRWSTRFAPHRSAHPDRPGYVAIHVAGSQQEDDANRQSLDADTNVESSPILATASLVEELQRKHPAASIGILTRKNQAVASILSELRRRGIDASQEGGTPIASHPAVGLILSWLTWLDHPADTASYFHVSQSIWANHLGLTDDMSTAQQLAENHRLALVTDGYAPTISRWVDQLATDLDTRSIGRLEQLIELAHLFDQNPTLRTSEFVHFVEKTKVDDPRPTRVRVMNIHQSKGLEFDIVLLPELNDRLRGHTPNLVLGFDNILDPPNVACRYVSEDDRRLLPERVRRAFDEEIIREQIENLSLLYVAITRARTQLHFLFHPSVPTEKNPPACLASIIRAGVGLTDRLIAGTTPYQLGVPQADSPQTDHSVDTLPPVRLTRRQTPTPSADSPLALAPSTANAQLASTREKLSIHPSSTTRNGSLIHQWISQWSWLDEPAPADADLLNLAREQFPDITAPEELLHSFRQWLKNDSIQQGLTRPAGQTELWRERRFVVELDSQILSGTWDRVVIVRNGNSIDRVELIDFKTDLLREPVAASIRAEHYRPQMLTYARALAAMLDWPLSAIQMELWFLTLGLRFPLHY
jgi:ATP-dependent exoDNAse (exonuclease V) beta subunit